MTCFCIRFCTTVLKIRYVLYSAILSQGYFKTLAGVARVLHRETCNQEMRTNRDIGKAGFKEMRLSSQATEPRDPVQFHGCGAIGREPSKTGEKLISYCI